MEDNQSLNNEDFDLVNLPEAAQDPEISKDDFTRVDSKNYTHEQKFQTKPTTFFKDSMRRFAKNKSSVVAAVILGLLLVLAFAVPAIESDVATAMTSYASYLEPKLFDAGTGWWDGCKKYTDIPAAVNEDGKLVPDPTSFKINAVLNGVNGVTDTGVKYRDSANQYASGGYMKLTANFNNVSGDYGYLRTNKFLCYSKDGDQEIVDTSKTLEYDLDDNDFGITLVVGNTEYPTEKYPSNVYTDFDLLFYYDKVTGDSTETTYVILKENISKDTPVDEPVTISSVSTLLKEKTSEEGNVLVNPRFAIGIKAPQEGEEFIALIKSFEFTFNEGEIANADLSRALLESSYDDANQCALRENEVYLYTSKTARGKFINPAGWSSNSSMSLYQASYHACSFTYDTYEAKLGLQTNFVLGKQTLEKYVNNGYISADLDISKSAKKIEIEILDGTHCPIVASEDNYYTVQNYDTASGTYEIVCDVQLYKYYGYTTMPRYLFGTDKSGNNMNKYTFEGLRNSLLLGVITSAICFIFGLIWGAISGYFGGATDIIMERFTDILSGVPWIVVMTLCIIKLGQSMLVFGLALCLTGWIGTAATTRTQFYRFKGREYVLASRTLGASDARLIAKHILPNAMGTIITKAVLMIPSVIFSEATISYLGLGLKGMSSLGVILSDNQAEILTHPYLLLFPSVIIALIMISFNLFGNGLRDAINPSLKGEDE